MDRCNDLYVAMYSSVPVIPLHIGKSQTLPVDSIIILPVFESIAILSSYVLPYHVQYIARLYCCHVNPPSVNDPNAIENASSYSHWVCFDCLHGVVGRSTWVLSSPLI